MSVVMCKACARGIVYDPDEPIPDRHRDVGESCPTMYVE